MMKLLLLLAMLGYGTYKLHKKTERWLEVLSPLLGSPQPEPGRATPASGPAAQRRISADGRPRAASPLRKGLVLGPLYALALVGFLTVGHWVTRAVAAGRDDAGADSGRADATDSGLDTATDPAAETVARASRELAYAMLDHPVQRLLIPAWRVVDVRREPGRCTEPLGPPELRNHVADVRLYTLFALPYRTVTVTCGGAVW